MPNFDDFRETFDKLLTKIKNLPLIGNIPLDMTMSDKTKLTAAVVVVFLISIVGGCALFGILSETPAPDEDQKIYVKIKSGMNARDVGTVLANRGIIDNRYTFWLSAKLSGNESNFKTGNYAFSRGMENDEVIAMLIEGSNEVFKFTIPEGFGVKEIASRLGKAGIVDEKKFLLLAKDFAPYKYMEKHKDTRYRAEGFLFPDTYIIDTDATTDDILDMMARDFDNRLTDDMRRRAKKMNLNIYELTTLASLVEKEARFEEDRPIIAQVFLKRLDLNMPLQSDATLQYLMDAPKEDVSITDTKIESPYNTYQNLGLPPGPIASPGLASIEAVLYPAETDYLYFVADRDGHNHYSYTYDEHLATVDEVR